MDVQIRCVCPPKADGEPRHAQDTVTLPEVLDFRRTLTIRQSIGIGMTSGSVDLPEIIALLIESYLLHCIDAWTLVDASGKAVPVSKQAVRDLLLVHYDEAEAVGDAADGLYTDKVVLPLLTRGSRFLPATPTDASTSRRSGRGTRPPKPSKRSSTSTIPTVVTATTGFSPGGASSSSLR